MPGSARSSTKSPTPVRRTLPSRSSRPLRASMRDGSDVDDVIQEVTRSPTGFRFSPVKPTSSRRAASSESDESGPSQRQERKKPRTKSVPRKCDEPDTDDSEEFSEISASEMLPVKRRRGRPPKLVAEPPEEEQPPEDSDENEEDDEGNDDEEDQSSSSSNKPTPMKRRRQQSATPEEEESSIEDKEDEPSTSGSNDVAVKKSRRRYRIEPDEEESSNSDGSDDNEPSTSRNRPQIQRVRESQRHEETPDGESKSESKSGSEDESVKQPAPKVAHFKIPVKETPVRRPRGRPRKEKEVKAATLNFSEVDSSEDSSATSDEDGRFDNEIVETAKALVKRLFLPIMKNNTSEMNVLFKGTFRESIINMPRKKYRTGDDSDAVPLTLKEGAVQLGKEICRVKRADRPSPEPPVKVHFIDTETMRPRMKNWVHIEHNIKTEDNLRLSHIPYVDDEHDSATFCRELTKAYPEGIHGIRHGWGKHISDYLLYLLLKQTVPQWKETKHDMRYLWRAIYKLFPNKLSARQLVFALNTLEQRFNPRAGGEDNTSKKDDMHHSISTILCIKCQQYHCLLHGVTSEEFRMHRKPMAKVHSRSQEPCGPDCYRLLETEEGGEKKRARKKSLTPLAPIAQIIFQKMIHNNRNPYCQVALMMNAVAPGEETRTCQDIYFMAQALPPPERERSPDDIMKRKISVKDQQNSFRILSWSNGKGRVDNSEPPKACRHQGACGQNVDGCYCGQQNTLCSKYCSCGPDCRLRFPGCRCQPGQCRTKSCQCFYAKWECDPDVCKSCNCGPYVFIPLEKPKEDQEENEDEEMTEEKKEEIRKNKEPLPVCSNINLQRGNYKCLKVGISNVAGYGCFLDDTAEKGEFIAEYTGEVISKWEAERRGRVYDEYKCSYIFALNREQSVDATVFGNHIRFANHSDKHPNCHSQIIIVNGEHRIGIFAKRRIEKGEELLFDYQYDKKWKEQYVPVEITKGGAIKQHKSRHYSPTLQFRKSKKHPNG